MKYLLVSALLLLPTVSAAHDRVVNGIVVPNGYAPAFEDGRINRDAGSLGSQAFVEAGHFHSQAAAEAAGAALGATVVHTREGHYSVLLGPYRNRDAAQAGLNAAHAAGLGHGWVR